MNTYKTKIWAVALFVAIITVLVYLPALKNDFVNWDDYLYAYRNQYIQSIDFGFFKWMFTTFHASNYWHPLTWLSHAIDYAIWGLNPMGHHLTSIILHGLSTFLVVILTIRLVSYGNPPLFPDNPPLPPLEKGGMGGFEKGGAWGITKEREYYSPIIAGAVTGLLFGLHPIHVESVAWVSERKDVLYAFFFLLSLLSYLKYTSYSLQNPPKSTFSKGGFRGINYALCLVFFIFSLMSKPMAITLPFVLIVLDFYPLGRLEFRYIFNKRGDMGIKVLIEKIPFIVLSLASSVVTVLSLQAGEAIASLEEYSFWTGIWVSIWALGFYLFKMALPINLAPLYPYPDKISFLNLTYIGSLLFIVIITVFCVYSWRKGKHIWLTAWIYYVLTLLPVLRIIKSGAQAAADRYTYLPSLGPFLLAGIGFSLLWKKTKTTIQGVTLKKYILIPSFLILVLLSVTTVNQIKIWKDSLTLWNTAIKLFPDSDMAYKNRGVAYLSLNNYRQAINDCNKAIQLNPYFANAYHTRGKSYLMSGNYEEASRNFNKAIELDPKSELFYFDRKLAYQLAIKDYSKAIKLNPEKIELYINRGSSFATIGQFDQALEDFNKAISLNSQLAIAYYNRGMVYRDLGNYQDAIENFQTAARLGDKQSQDYLKLKGIGW